jgi:hypothetical protein
MGAFFIRLVTENISFRMSERMAPRENPQILEILRLRPCFPAPLRMTLLRFSALALRLMRRSKFKPFRKKAKPPPGHPSGGLEWNVI